MTNAPGLGSADLLFKFAPPETVERFGGADAIAEAVDGTLDELARLLPDPEAMRRTIFGQE